MDWNTPIHYCSMHGHARCLESLLRQHPQLNIKNKFNKYPMDESVNKEIIVVSLLLFLIPIQKRDKN